MNNFHQHSVPQVLEFLKTSPAGLSEKETKLRKGKYGSNNLVTKKPLGAIVIFFSQFNNSLIYILVFTGILSFSIGALKESIVIASAIVLNAVFGFFQENKANQALLKLRRLSSHKALLIRDGQELSIDSSELVPGDIIILRAGNRVPADARIIESNSLMINEASLTGESEPSRKFTNKIDAEVPLLNRANMAYSGTIIMDGNGKAVVTAIGSSTEIGKIAVLVREIHEERTPLQVRLEKFSRFLGMFFIATCLLIVFFGLSEGRPFLEMIETGVAVGVASIPEGLTVAITFVLALGMQNILKEKALTRKLVAAETLGSVTVICSDKTGTLTKGEMSVDRIVIGEKEFELVSPDDKQSSEEAKSVSLALQTALMCNDAFIENPDAALDERKFIGSPTEIALLRAATEAGLRKEKISGLEPKIAGIPFDSARKHMLSLHRHENGTFVLYEKGAPEILLAKSTHYYQEGKIRILNEEEKTALIKNYEKMTAKGLRVIGTAIRHFGHHENEFAEDSIEWAKIDTNLCFIGFIALKDPLRKEAKETVRSAISAGIKPVIITGDHRLTARAIALELGLAAKNENILVGEELEKISDEQLKDLAPDIDVYARVSPHHKLRIVRALQARGEVVAMTGDGINDSPAIKAADIGISLGNGTDVAKETADLVLLDNNFKTIILAIKQGRIIYRNIQKIITYLISDSFSEIILITGSILLGSPLAVLPAQILWINIVNDSLPNFSLAFERGDKALLSNKPVSKSEPLLTKQMLTIIFAVGLIRDMIVFGIFYTLYSYWHSYEELMPALQTIIFATLGVKSLMSIFSIRHLHSPIWKHNPFSNKVLVAAVFTSFMLLYVAIEWKPLQELLSTTHLSMKEWLIPILIGLLGVSMTELVKLHFSKKEA